MASESSFPETRPPRRRTTLEPHPIRSCHPLRPHVPNESGAVDDGCRVQGVPSVEQDTIPESNDDDPGNERKPAHEAQRSRTGWLITTVGSDEPAYPMCYIGLAGGAAPSTPFSGDTARRRAGSDPPLMRPSPVPALA